MKKKTTKKTKQKTTYMKFHIPKKTRMQSGIRTCSF